MLAHCETSVHITIEEQRLPPLQVQSLSSNPSTAKTKQNKTKQS
jgi:hypothetical protein